MSVLIWNIPDHKGGPRVILEVVEVNSELYGFLVADSLSFPLGGLIGIILIILAIIRLVWRLIAILMRILLAFFLKD